MADLLNEKLESVFASPLDIADLQASANSILAALPAETEVQVHMACDEESAELSFTYSTPQFNPLISLPHLPVDGANFTADDEQGCSLTLTKTLA